MVLAKGLRGRSRYCWAGRDKVDSRAVATLKGRDLTAFVVSFASAMPQLECKNGVSLSIRENQCIAVANVVTIFGQTRFGFASADPCVKE